MKDEDRIKREKELIAKHPYLFGEFDESKRRMLQHTKLAEEYFKARTDKDQEKMDQIKKEQEELGPFESIAFGIEHDVGWFDLIDELMTKIEEVDIKKEVRITQIKEKMGGLRFYTRGSPVRIDILNLGSLEMGESSDGDKIRELISETEDRSFHICEICGEPGRLCRTTGRWYKTVCKEHRKLKCWDDTTMEYFPIQGFGVGEEVITPVNILSTIKSVEYRDSEDEFYYVLDDGDIRPQTELQPIPDPKYLDGWYVTKDSSGLEWIIADKKFSPDSGWTYTIEPDQSILGINTITAKEDELKLVFTETKNGYKMVKSTRIN